MVCDGCVRVQVGQKLAINTAQFSRVFQDRSFIFAIRQRPAALVGHTIVNLNVRGKRGNIVQVYPSVESAPRHTAAPMPFKPCTLKPHSHNDPPLCALLCGMAGTTSSPTACRC